MSFASYPALILLFFYIENVYSLNDPLKCEINVKEGMSDDPPMLLRLNPIKYVYPKVYTLHESKHLILPKGSVIYMFCPSKTKKSRTEVEENGVIEVHGKEFKRSETSTLIKCLGNNKFKLQNQAGNDLLEGTTIDDFKKISCIGHGKGKSYGAIIRKTKENCLQKADGTGRKTTVASIYKIGHDLNLPTNEFLETIELCHDKRANNTLWAHSVIISTINQERSQTKKRFSKRPYTREHQLNIALQLFNNNDDLVKKYFFGPKGNFKKDKSFDIGHLIADADKFHESEQSSTYILENTLPMWNTTNRQTWKYIEDRIRRIAGDKKVDLDIWAGGIGILELENIPFYLKPGSPNQIPVPKIIFKIVIDTHHKQALVFLVVNNPHLSDSEVEGSKDKYIVCKTFDYCREKLFWKSYESAGYYYCCMLDDFYKKHAKDLGLMEKLKKYKDYSALTWSTALGAKFAKEEKNAADSLAHSFQQLNLSNK